jgi:TatA/E family protein of Tat protein translocase
MGSISFGEILTILLVILIIFGPSRLPEMARKVGEAIAWSRRALRQFTDEIQSEYGEDTQPFVDIKTELDAARQDLTDIMGTMAGMNDASPKGPTPDDTPADETDGDPTAAPDADNGNGA